MPIEMFKSIMKEQGVFGKLFAAAVFSSMAAVALANEAAVPQIVDGTHGYMPEAYVEVTDPLVKAEIEKFRDRKLALMMHFGVYTQLGIHESWPLVDAESKWSRKLVDWTDGETLKKQYLGMWKSFNPVRLQPDRWAVLAWRKGDVGRPERVLLSDRPLWVIIALYGVSSVLVVLVGLA